MPINQLNNGDSGLTARTIINELVDFANSGSVDTGSFATTGSNVFVGNQTISGSINFGDGSQIQSISASSGDGYGYATLEIKPDVTLNTDQYIVLDPTAPNHIHIRTGGTIDNSNAYLYLGGEKNHVRVSDNSPTVRMQTTSVININTYYFNVGVAYTTAVWETVGDVHQITINDPLQSIYDAVWAYNNVSLFSVVDNISNPTLQILGSSTPGGPNPIVLTVNLAPPSSPTNLDQLYFEINQERETYIQTDGTDIRMEASDDVRIFSNDIFRLANYSVEEGFEIHTDYNNADHEWYFGVDGKLSMPGALEQGQNVFATGSYSHAEGKGAQAIGDYSHAEGYQTDAGPNQAIGIGSHVEGLQNITIGIASHAEGTDTQTIGFASHTEGFITRAGWRGFDATNTSGTASISQVGDFTSVFIAPGIAFTDAGLQTYNSSSFDGSNTVVYLDNTGAGISYIADINDLNNPSAPNLLGPASHAEGRNTQAIGDASHAEGGGGTKAIGNYSHAEGNQTQAIGIYSHTEGYLTIASGSHSHAEGSNTQAIGTVSHAEGRNSITIGEYSHAEGYQTITLGNGSHAEGRETIASGSFQHVSGQYNTHGDNTSLFIIGNGTSDGARSDAFKVRQSGSIILPVTSSNTPTWTGVDGEMMFGDDGSGNYVIWAYLGGQWRSGSLN